MITGAQLFVRPPEARSATVTVSPFSPVFGPRLSGRDLLWTTPTSSEGYLLRRAGAMGSNRRTALRVTGRRGFDAEVRLAASTDEVLLQHALIERSPPVQAPTQIIDLGTVRLLEGGNLERLSSAGAGAGTYNVRNIDLDGSRALFPSSNGSDATVRDFATSIDMQIAGVGSNLRLSGRFAAWIATSDTGDNSGDIVVYDLGQQREAYRVPRPSLGVGSIALQADGKVAFSYGVVSTGNGSQRLGWASPSEPRVHSLPPPPAVLYTVRLLKDVVVFERSATVGIDEAPGVLGFASLAGGHGILARSVSVAAAGADDRFDFDGANVAWLEPSCRGTEIRTNSLAALKAHPRRRGSPNCRLQLARRVRLNARRDLVVPFSCRGFRRICTIDRVTVRTARSYRIGGRPRPRGFRLSTTQIGRTRLLRRLRLSPEARRTFARRGSAYLRIAANVSDSEGFERRQRLVVVR